MYEEDELLPPKPSPWKSVSWLITAAVITVMIWQIPFGGLMLYPFTILATWFHEMGHGLTALLLGGSFNTLTIYPNGSGVARHVTTGHFQLALVAAGGLLGPPIAGSFFILAGRSPGSSRLILNLLGGALLLSTLIWVRTPFGWGILPLMGLSLLATSRFGAEWLQPLVVQFLGVQACIASLRQLDYLFMPSAVVGGRRMLSDTGHIAAALFLPYWFWGSVIAGLSFVLLAGSLWFVARHPKPASSDPYAHRPL